MDAKSLRRQVLLSTTMLVGALAGYGGRAYGACALTTAPNIFTCSGANAVQQTIATNNADVSTLAGFSVVTGGDQAVRIVAAGDLSYPDANASTLTAASIALYIASTGNAGAVPGAVTVDTNGALTAGGFGIYARNQGSGAVTVTANGDVTGTGAVGIFARNLAAGTDLSVTTGAGTNVMGGYGIFARNYGSGALSVTANGDVTGTIRHGIEAQNFNGTDLSVTTGAGTNVTGATRGIYARNFGSGALSIAADGDVTGTSNFGI